MGDDQAADEALRLFEARRWAEFEQMMTVAFRRHFGDDDGDLDPPAAPAPVPSDGDSARP